MCGVDSKSSTSSQPKSCRVMDMEKFPYLFEGSLNFISHLVLASLLLVVLTLADVVAHGAN
jgi:hypothetical protein